MSSVIEHDIVRAAVHRVLYAHFNKRPEVTFDVRKVRTLIAQDGIAATDDLAREADMSALILETIEDHIIFLWRNGASHTFRRVGVPGAAPAWKYSDTPAAP